MTDQMQYALLRTVLDGDGRLLLTASEFEKLKQSWERVTASIDIEENWDCLVRNFADLEISFLRTSLEDSILSRSDFNEIHDIRLGFTRHLANFLSSARTYLDHAPTQLANISEKLPASFRRLTNERYDRSFSYRLMEALRNYSQHSGKPLHSISFASRWNDDRTQHTYSSGASILVEKLLQDSNFKRSVFQGFEADRVPVQAACRLYLEGLSEVHFQTRKGAAKFVTAAKQLINSRLDDFSTLTGEGRYPVTAVRLTKDEAIIREFDLPDFVLDWHGNLTSRHRSLVNLSKRIVSSACDPSNGVDLT